MQHHALQALPGVATTATTTAQAVDLKRLLRIVLPAWQLPTLRRGMLKVMAMIQSTAGGHAQLVKGMNRPACDSSTHHQHIQALCETPSSQLSR